MKNPIIWTVSLKICGQTETKSFKSKKAAVHHYLDILDAPWSKGSELKIFKNDIEYTGTLNRFLTR